MYNVPLELLELSNRFVSVNVLRPLSVVVAQFSTLYKIIGDISEWNRLVDVLVGMLNLAITHKRGLSALFALSYTRVIQSASLVSCIIRGVV